MKFLKNILLLFILTLTTAAYAKASEKGIQPHDSGNAVPITEIQAADVAYVSVNGLVCDFCARALEKVFSKEESVEAIDVNLDTKIITVNFKQGQNLSDERLKKLIVDAGYNVESIRRGK